MSSLAKNNNKSIIAKHKESIESSEYLSKKREKESIKNTDKVKTKIHSKTRISFISDDEEESNNNGTHKTNKDLKKKEKNDLKLNEKKSDDESENNSDKEDLEIVANTGFTKNPILEACLPTISIALPSSIIDNAQSKELRSYLVGQIARTCSIFKVDEIIIFHDSLNKGTYKDKLNFCLTNLQYLETPQYLRKLLFPISDELSMVGLMNPLDCDHHLRSNEYLKYREGVVLNRPVKDNKGSWVNIGLKKDCFVDVSLPDKTRVTIKLDKDCKELHHETEIVNTTNNYLANSNLSKKFYTGKVISSMEPKSKGHSWGYIVRVVDKFEDLFCNSIFNNDKYDLIIGTSDKGELHTEIELSKQSKKIKKIINKKKIDKISHALIVFGGIQGLEGVVEDEEENKLNSETLTELFDFYVNTCPKQGTRTIRTEEALMITLSVLKDKIKNCNN